MKIYLIRHGETDWNKEHRIQGQIDIPLNEYGVRLAETTAEALNDVPFEAAFCSPLARARKTAEIIVGTRDIPLTPDPRLKEIGFGDREGESIKKIAEDPSDPIYNFLRKPDLYEPTGGGESLQALYARSRAFLDEVITPLEQRYAFVLIVAHSALIRSIVNPLAGYGRKDFWEIPMKNCNVSIVSLENGQYRLLEASRQYCEGRV